MTYCRQVIVDGVYKSSYIINACSFVLEGMDVS